MYRIEAPRLPTWMAFAGGGSGVVMEIQNGAGQGRLSRLSRGVARGGKVGALVVVVNKSRH